MKKTFRKKTLRKKTFRKKTFRKNRGGYTEKNQGSWSTVVFDEKEKTDIKDYLKKNPGASSTVIRDKLFPDMSENLKENASWEIHVVLGRAYSGSGGYKIELELEDDDIYKIKNYLKNWPRASPNEISDEEFPKITNEFKKNVLAQIKFAMDDKTFFKSLLKKHGLRDYKEF